jgi:hypothetical protein
LRKRKSSINRCAGVTASPEPSVRDFGNWIAVYMIGTSLIKAVEALLAMLV